IRSGTFNFSNLKLTENGIQYEDIQARHLIFCEGWQAVRNPYFGWLPLSINKGEVLEIGVQNFPTGCIYNKGVYVVPLGEERWKVGATYNWREPNEEPTEAGREELLGKVNQLLKVPVEVTAHAAGIRPATRDRKPLIGTHPELPQLSIFNGMGSKGVLMAPFLAAQFADCLAGKSEIWPEVSIARYRKFFHERDDKK
ncbi:MAG TPA: FAD-dependent oxidoreductase, partial [Flavisolibacter sp.]|nr:FAD-dependent oxidoreductase [Flavisolibacter sp.]